VQHGRVVAGGNHGDVAFQFGASAHIEISDGSTIYFEVSVLELICKKDAAKLIEATILPGLTSGLKKMATLSLHIHHEEQDGKIHCKFSNTSSILSPQHLMTIEKVDCYITCDLTFQECQWAGSPWLGIGVCNVWQTDLSSWANIHYG
jgi:hypothetical protein